MSGPAGCPPAPPVPEPSYPPDLVPPPLGLTQLVTNTDDPVVCTATRLTDALTATRRGLAEYLEQVFLDIEGVRVRLQKVHPVWAEGEETAVFPSAAIVLVGDLTYDASSLTPTLDPTCRLPDGGYLVKYSELTATLMVDLFASSPDERAQVMLLLEDALNPVDWRYGFVLELPHYHNVRAVYELATAQSLDSEGTAIRRWREGSAVLNVRVPVVRPRTLPTMEVRVGVEVVDGA